VDKVSSRRGAYTYPALDTFKC